MSQAPTRRPVVDKPDPFRSLRCPRRRDHVQRDLYASAQAGGSVTGTVKDTTGGVIPGATVTLMNTALGNQFTAVTDGQGVYSFPNVPVGRYDLTIALEGFKPHRRAGVAVDINSRLQIDATLEVGEQTETVTVTAERRCTSRRRRRRSAKSCRPPTMTTLSLNGRSYTDLLAIQPGVIPVTTHAVRLDHHGRRHRRRSRRRASSIPAIVSISGQREIGQRLPRQRQRRAGTHERRHVDRAQPRLDRSVPRADEQLRSRSTATTTAASSTSSRSRAATCSTGARFEFVRNTALDARTTSRPSAPSSSSSSPAARSAVRSRRASCSSSATIRARARRRASRPGIIPVPSLAERGGNFSDGSPSSLTGTVNGPYWASLLSQRLGYTVSAGRAVLHAGLHELRAVRASERDHSDARVVVAGAAAAAVHPDAERRRRRLFDRRVRADRARRQGIAPHRRQQPRSVCCPGYYFVDDYRLDNPYPGAAGRRERAGLRRADDRPRAALVVRQQQGLRLEHRQRISLQLHAQRQQHRHAERRPRRRRSRRRASSPVPARRASSSRRRSSKASRTSCSTRSPWA